MLCHAIKHNYRAQSFLRYTGRQKAIASMVKQLTKGTGSRTLIGFGDMGRTDQGGAIKGCVRGPVAGLEHALRQARSQVSLSLPSVYFAHPCL